MASERAKRDCGGVEVEKEPDTLAEDRISQLPDPLIHYIFSFLPTFYIIQMSILSKRWRRMWVSTPFMYLEDFCGIHKKKYRERLLKFVSSCLRHRMVYKRVPETSIVRFQFDTSYSLENTGGVKGWFSFLIERNVRELDLNFKYCILPQFVLSAISLTVLKLRGMKLETSALSNLHSLKVLSLIDVIFDVKSLQNLISGCPIIENFQVNGKYTYDHVHFSISKTLKYLSLSDLMFTCQWLEGLIYGLPLLEKLTLELPLCSCNGLKNISIRSHSLKSLYCKGGSENISIHSHTLISLKVHTWSNYWKSCNIDATFRTPNLVCLSLSCGAQSVISIEAPNLFECDLNLRYDSDYVSSYDDTVHFLANFNSLKKMTLCIREQEIIFPRNIRNTCSPPLPNLKHLKLKIPDHNLKRKSELEDSVYWCAPYLETLEVDG